MRARSIRLSTALLLATLTGAPAAPAQPAAPAPAATAPPAPTPPPATPGPSPSASAAPAAPPTPPPGRDPVAGSAGETSATPPTASAAPAPPPPASAAAAPPPAAPVATPVVITIAAPTEAVVHVAADYPDAWLELRSSMDGGPWSRACPIPCDRNLVVDGTEARVTAPGMVTSNTFRIEAGSGTARLRVNGGSQTARTVGLTLLIAGLPVTFGGMTAVGIGAVQDEGALRTAGIVGLAVGGVAVLASLPLLLRGSTNVRNEQGDYIAGLQAAPRL